MQLQLGEHGHSRLCHTLTGYEPKEMELTDAVELNLATTSDIYFQHTLDDTASFPNDPDVDDNELAEFLAVVVDRTGKLVEVRSNNDQFSCDIRNLKSAQSQFPLVTQPKKMIGQTGRSVQERIAEERESSNAQIRTMLDEQRRTIIAECNEKSSSSRTPRSSSRTTSQNSTRRTTATTTGFS